MIRANVSMKFDKRIEATAPNTHPRFHPGNAAVFRSLVEIENRERGSFCGYYRDLMQKVGEEMYKKEEEFIKDFLARLCVVQPEPPLTTASSTIGKSLTVEALNRARDLCKGDIVYKQDVERVSSHVGDALRFSLKGDFYD